MCRNDIFFHRGHIRKSVWAYYDNGKAEITFLMGTQGATDMAVFGVIIKISFVQLRLSEMNHIKC